MHIATSSDNIDISSEKKIEEIAKKIQKKIKVGDVVFFYGEMGVGKTTFIKYLINHFEKISNTKLSEVTSPTFNLLNEYKIKDIQILNPSTSKEQTYAYGRYGAASITLEADNKLGLMFGGYYLQVC